MSKIPERGGAYAKKIHEEKKGIFREKVTPSCLKDMRGS